MIRNNVTRLLDAHKIAYTPMELPVEKIGAQEAAALMGVPQDQVFKTIVVLREGRGKPILAVIPGDREDNLKQVAQAVGEKKVKLATERQAEQTTGLQAGGISPLALINKGFQVLIERKALDFEAIYVSGGQRGLNIHLSPRDLATLTKAEFSDLTNE
jgi:Cys-tRNA(Pro)/Cys-tRNA(Cys) deacylase